MPAFISVTPRPIDISTRIDINVDALQYLIDRGELGTDIVMIGREVYVCEPIGQVHKLILDAVAKLSGEPVLGAGRDFVALCNFPPRPSPDDAA